jgi:hypothetical protein
MRPFLARILPSAVFALLSGGQTTGIVRTEGRRRD